MSKDTNNRGAMFKAKNKKTDKHPDYSGSLIVEGVKYWVSGWACLSQAGEKYLSFSINKKDNQGEVSPPEQNQASTKDPEFDDDLPF